MKPRAEETTNRKLRALACSKKLAAAIGTAHAAYVLCARRTKDPNVTVAAENAAASLAASFRLEPPRLGDRLRLEWLAALPNPDVGLLGECARVLGDAIAWSDATVADRLRLASAEAYSLTQAVSRSSASSAEAGWRAAPKSVAFLSFAR